MSAEDSGWIGSWVSRDPRDRSTQLVISRAGGQLAIYYFSDGAGSCEIQGEVARDPEAPGARLVFNSWKPETNREVNPLLTSRREACTLELVRAPSGVIRARALSSACADACERQGLLDRELRRR